MRCMDCQGKVEEYLDGELDKQTTEEIARHLGACAACQSLYARLEEEQELYLSYEYDAQPAPDFWDNILARTADESAARPVRPFSLLRDWTGRALERFNAVRLSPALAALLVLVAIGITIAVMRYTNSREESAVSTSVVQNDAALAPTPATLPDEVIETGRVPEEEQAGGKGSEPQVNERQQQLAKNRAGRKDRNPATIAVSTERNVRVALKPGASGRSPTSDELVREAEQKYVAAIAMLSRDANRRRSRLDAETAARFAQTLAAVDRTIVDTRRAARKHPGDPVAAQYMLTAYAKKVDVLREIVSY